MNNVLNKNKEYIIHIDLEGKDDLYDEYNWNILNDKLASYINKQVSRSKLDDKIIIEIYAGFTMNKEKEKMRNCILEYYNDVLKECKIYYKVDVTKKIFLMLFGLIALVVARNIEVAGIISELLNIAGWVAVWEVVYSLLFTDNERKFKQKRAKQLVKAEIIFK